jgi:dTDP-4-amino-4,6-dideoxygalactose transaminase
MKYFDMNDIFAALKWTGKNQINAFEDEFSRYINTKYAIATSWGRTALYLGLKAIGATDKEVIVPAFTCTVVLHAVIVSGATPIFVDVDAETIEMDLEDLKKKITSKTKAVILTHYFGRVARNIDEVIQIARNNNISLIEDCAHSLGAEYKGRKVGTFGDFSIFSLTKNMINYGGGFMLTNDGTIYQNARCILKQDEKSAISRMLDFPLVLAYGLEQAVNKLVLDRVGKQKWWWLTKAPNILIRLRSLLLSPLKLRPIFFNLSLMRNKSGEVNGEEKKIHSNYHSLNMEPIIASLGRSQFRKIDHLVHKRKEAFDTLAAFSHMHAYDELNSKDVYTYVVLRFKDKDLFKVIEQCKAKGLSLRATWPTRQKLWAHQQTHNVLTIKKEYLLWSINPDLTESEKSDFMKIISTVNGNGLEDAL